MGEALGLIHSEGEFLFMCKTMKLKEQVICSQNTMVGQAWDTSYRAFYSKREKRKEKKNKKTPTFPSSFKTQLKHQYSV